MNGGGGGGQDGFGLCNMVTMQQDPSSNQFNMFCWPRVTEYSSLFTNFFCNTATIDRYLLVHHFKASTELIF